MLGWLQDPDSRPSFSDLGKTFKVFLEDPLRYILTITDGGMTDYAKLPSNVLLPGESTYEYPDIATEAVMTTSSTVEYEEPDNPIDLATEKITMNKCILYGICSTEESNESEKPHYDDITNPIMMDECACYNVTTTKENEEPGVQNGPATEEIIMNGNIVYGNSSIKECNESENPYEYIITDPVIINKCAAYSVIATTKEYEDDEDYY